jgi:hypothetical protein
MLAGTVVLLSGYGVYALLERRAAWQQRLRDYGTVVEMLFVHGDIDEQERRLLRRQYLVRYWKTLR